METIILLVNNGKSKVTIDVAIDEYSISNCYDLGLASDWEEIGVKLQCKTGYDLEALYGYLGEYPISFHACFDYIVVDDARIMQIKCDE